MSVRPVAVSITSGTAVTAASVPILPRERVVAVIGDTAWTAADIGFQFSLDGTNFFDAVDASRVAATSFARIVNVDAAAAHFYIVPATLDFPAGSFLNLTSINTGSNAAVNQVATRSLTVVLLRTPT